MGRLRFVTRGAVMRLAILLGALLLVVTCAWNRCIRMPGRARPSVPPGEGKRPDLAGELRRDLTVLAGEIGERHVGRPENLRRAKDWIAAELAAAGWTAREEKYEADGVVVANLVAERRGTERPEEILIVGAHYDTVPDCPGANDNGTGVVG
ncbi:MAG: M28 family peptidase, partial [Planctomycetota bacterium]